MPKDYNFIKAYKSNEEIANVAHDILTRHGIPVHYQLLSRMVARELDKDFDPWDNTPQGKSWDAKVLRALNTHPHYFKRLEPGVYTLQKRQG